MFILSVQITAILLKWPDLSLNSPPMDIKREGEKSKFSLSNL